ncbi:MULTISPECIES: acyltransferase family protein [unclassified Rhizobium]|uniref:acyltransferase family protein n=1 Tax=unclassified Rhizobium TaxID=2613769 RepID=UPI000EA8F726|nr:MULTISPECIES: acyltransferase family protein [unclassified Rhizobium]AYG70159.1 acyltransferase [Rhizobium sp. CCGE531]AYG76534.1 acyltransferase [Rhizobium sp. CCGE532]
MYDEQLTADPDSTIAPKTDKGAGRIIHITKDVGSSMKGAYRPDIDGLRAVAVGLVLLYHTGVTPLRGGFIGVDVFFVISGYLITQLLRTDLDAGSFRISSFYERRILRILPALFCVSAATLAIAPFILFPVELRTLAETAISALLSASNLYLLGSDGYFGADTLSQPLLHTWSLGVEEQFYLIFPLLMVLLTRRPVRTAQWTIGAILLTSLGAGVALAYINRDYAYYFPMTRAWELLIGALFAFVPTVMFSRRIAELATAIAFALLLACAVKFHSGLAFPGFYAVAPCLAVAIIIFFGSRNKTVVNNLLASSAFVWFGKISYSVYLWHWPVLIYYQLSTGQLLNVKEAAVLCVAITLIGALSWRYVEQPFRTRRIVRNRLPIWTGALVGTIMLCAAATATLLLSVHQPFNEGERLAAYLDYDENPVYRLGTCFMFGHIDSIADFQNQACLNASTTKPNVLIVGDSHAAHLWSGLNGAMRDMNVMQATATGCKPVLGARGERGCVQLMNMVFDEYLQRQPIDILVLSARWIRQDTPDVSRTLEMLRGKVGKIVVFGPIVEYYHPLPRLLGQSDWRNDTSILVTARNNEQRGTDEELAHAVTAAGASYVSTYSLLCPENGDACTTLTEGVPVQWDYGHLTAEGSTLVATRAIQTGLLTVNK